MVCLFSIFGGFFFKEASVLSTNKLFLKTVDDPENFSLVPNFLYWQQESLGNARYLQP